MKKIGKALFSFFFQKPSVNDRENDEPHAALSGGPFRTVDGQAERGCSYKKAFKLFNAINKKVGHKPWVRCVGVATIEGSEFFVYIEIDHKVLLTPDDAAYMQSVLMNNVRVYPEPIKAYRGVKVVFCAINAMRFLYEESKKTP